MTRTAVIMQPTYLPWVGFFDLIDQSDVCVFLDDVQFSKQSWQQRNRIRTSRGLEWLTVPVRRSGKVHIPLIEIEIVTSTGFPRDHIRGIELSYARAPFFEQFNGLREILGRNESRLAELNIQLIRWIAGALGIETRFFRSSALKAVGRRSELMNDICQRVEADTYLSPAGATYLKEEVRLYGSGGVKVLFHEYEHPVYRQLFHPFMPYASVIDLLLNEGAEALGIIRSGRKASVPSSEV